MKIPPDDRAPLARAYQRTTRGTAVAMGMVIPGLVGYFLDKQLGTTPLLTILGFGLGVTFGIWELVQMTRPPRDENSDA